MTLRSPSRGEYWKRMAIVVLLGFAAYATVISEKGGGATFKVWRPERMRFAALMLVVVGVAAYELRPRRVSRSGDDPEQESQGAISNAAETSAAREPVVPFPVEEPSVAAPTAVASVREEVAKRDSADDKRASHPDAIDCPAVQPQDAEAIWNQARVMAHGFVPDEINDREYLNLVRQAADLGHVYAQVKLGDYAFRRGWIVEAYYWTLRAQLLGAEGLEPALREIRRVWVLEESPLEYENVRLDFSEEQGVFARAALRLTCGFDVPFARQRLRDLRDRGCLEAKLFLARAEDQKSGSQASDLL